MKLTSLWNSYLFRTSYVKLFKPIINRYCTQIPTLFTVNHNNSYLFREDRYKILHKSGRRGHYFLQAQSNSIMSSAVQLPEEVRVNKDKYLSMELDKKRSLYKCKDDYVTLDKVINWREYFIKQNVHPTSGSGKVDEKKFEVNETLNSKVSLWQGDITVLEIDAIVNAANSSLLGGGGVDGAIHRAAGSNLLNECRELKGCPAGQAKITGGYKLPSKHVIHTVGPQGEKPEVLRSCYVNSLQLMLENKLKSIAFPCIATGVYGYPREKAANVALLTVREFLEKNAEKVDRVIFTVFLEEDKAVYEELLQKYFPL